MTLIADIENAVELANSFRVATGQPLIDDLPPGIEGDAKECVLAKAFDSDLMVAEDEEYYLYDIFDQETADKIAGHWSLYGWVPEDKLSYLQKWTEQSGLLMIPEKDLHKRVRRLPDLNGMRQYEKQYRISIFLPPEVYTIAKQFDNGRLDAKYYLKLDDY